MSEQSLALPEGPSNTHEMNHDETSEQSVTLASTPSNPSDASELNFVATSCPHNLYE